MKYTVRLIDTDKWSDVFPPEIVEAPSRAQAIARSEMIQHFNHVSEDIVLQVVMVIQ